MNDDDGRDISAWDDFFVSQVVYYSNAVLKQMIADIQQELKEREIEDK